MDISPCQLDLAYYTATRCLRHRARRAIGRRIYACRFVHLEFFRLAEDKEEPRQEGDFVGPEVITRSRGRLMGTPDMMNYAH